MSLPKIYSTLFDYDKELTQNIYQQSLAGLTFLARLAFLGSIFFAVYDYSSGHFKGFFIRVFLAFISYLYILFNKFFRNKYSFESSKIIIILFFVLEIETELVAPDVQFYDPLTWFIIPLLILFHAFYFIGTPGTFFIFWFVLIFYYYVRVSFSLHSGFLDHNLLSILAYFFVTWLFAGFLNLFWFRIRYFNLLQSKMLLEETQRRIEIEKELASQNERQKIFAEIHDYAGSYISDMHSILNLLEKNEMSRGLINDLKGYLIQLEDNLRLKIQMIEDLEIFKQDPLNGIRLLVQRRYTIHKREINFFLEEECYFASIDSFIDSLFAIVQENATNDLKFGYGLSIWKFFIYKKNLCLEIFTKTKYEEKNAGKGFGQNSIYNRLNNLSGIRINCEESGYFHSRFYFPL